MDRLEVRIDGLILRVYRGDVCLFCVDLIGDKGCFCPYSRGKVIRVIEAMVNTYNDKLDS